MDSTVVPFIRKSSNINTTILNILHMKLGLLESELTKKHALNEFSGSEARTMNLKGMLKERTVIGAHMEFLHNQLGRLQVLPPGVDQWYYIKM
ncbi:hypothetical protein V5O48_010867, partial [Marasmius crinis-equi]